MDGLPAVVHEVGFVPKMSAVCKLFLPPAPLPLGRRLGAAWAPPRLWSRVFRLSAFGFRLWVAGVVGLLAATLAAATIWLLFTDPVTVADAVSEGDGTLLRQLAAVIIQAILRIARYL